MLQYLEKLRVDVSKSTWKATSRAWPIQKEPIEASALLTSGWFLLRWNDTFFCKDAKVVLQQQQQQQEEQEEQE